MKKDANKQTHSVVTKAMSENKNNHNEGQEQGPTAAAGMQQHGSHAASRPGRLCRARAARWPTLRPVLPMLFGARDPDLGFRVVSFSVRPCMCVCVCVCACAAGRAGRRPCRAGRCLPARRARPPRTSVWHSLPCFMWWRVIVVVAVGPVGGRRPPRGGSSRRRARGGAVWRGRTPGGAWRPPPRRPARCCGAARACRRWQTRWRLLCQVADGDGAVAAPPAPGRAGPDALAVLVVAA